jgi:hypothetical protein
MRLLRSVPKPCHSTVWCRKCAVFLLRDLDRQRVYRLYDFNKALLLRPSVAYLVAARSTAPMSSTSCSNRSDSTPSIRWLPILPFLLTAREGRV